MEQYFRTRASVDDDPDLARNRRANDARLKSRFEHIFEKYGKDFEGVGDEIDLETGHIVVNNGHIARMQHEVDPGQGASSQVLRVLEGSLQDKGTVHGEGFVIEDSTEELDDSEELVASATSGDSSSDAEDDDDVEEEHRPIAGVSDELSSDFYPIPNATPENPHRLAQKLSERRPAGKRRSDSDQAVGQIRATSRRKSPEDQPMDLPFLQDSVKSMQALPSQNGSVDLDAIQALGQSIAKQLARYMNSGSKTSRRASSGRAVVKDSRWDYPTLPGDDDDRTPSPPRPASTSAALFTASPDRVASIWAPQRQRKKRKSKLQSQLVHEPAIVDGDDDVDPLQSDPPQFDPPLDNHLQDDPPSQADPEISDDPEEIVPIDCYNCGVTNSRAWRTGPDGRLCDSCGAYYGKYGLLKAVEDPSSTSAPRPRPQSTADRRVYTHTKADLFAIPSTDTPETTAGYAANTARRITAEGRKGRFTLEEEECIIRLHEIDGVTWDHIGFLVSHRSAYAVHRHYQKSLKKADCEARRRLLHNSVPVRTFGISTVAMSSAYTEQNDGQTGDIEAFTTSENETMSRLREQEGMTWAEIAGHLPGRTSHELQAHYYERLKKGHLSSSVPDPVSPALDENNTTPTARTTSSSSVPIQTSAADRTAHQQREHTIEHSLSYDTSLASGPRGDDAPADRSRSKRSTARSTLENDARSQMLPPPVPSRGSSRRNAAASTALFPSDLGSHGGPMARAGSRSKRSPQTPSLQAGPVSAPPTNPQVGPSAWASTQPTSKGPLPFQPARKGLAPLRAKSASRGLRDPFISHKKPAALVTPPPSNPTTSSHGLQEDVPSLESTVSPSRSHVTGQSLRDRASSDTEIDTMHVHQDPITTPPFTPTQDRFIMRARETQNLTWEAIAKALPSEIPQTASAIMHRYYDFLLNNTLSTQPQETQKGQLSESGTTRFTEGESRQVAQYKSAGMSWIEMADRIPRHTAFSIQKHYNDFIARGGHGRTALEHGHHSDTLLHQAMKNLARRKSDIAGAGLRPEDGMHGITPSSASSRKQSATVGNGIERSGATFDGDGQASPGFLPTEENAYAQPNQEDEYTMSMDPHEANAGKLSANGQGERASPKTKRGRKSSGAPNDTTATSSRRREPPVSSVPNAAQSPDPQELYITSPECSTNGSGSHERLPQSHPQVVINVGKRAYRRASSNQARSGGESLIDMMKASLGQNSPDTNGGAFPEKEDDAIAIDPQVSNKVTLKGTKRKRRSGRSKRLSEAVVADSDSDSASCQVQAEKPTDISPALPATTAPVKRRPGRPRKHPLIQPNDTPQVTIVPEQNSRPQRKTRKTHETLNVIELVERFADQEDDGRALATSHTDDAASGTSDQDLDRTEHHDALEDLDIARPEAAETAQVSREFSDQPEESERPEIDWKELVYEIMRSAHGKATRCRDVIAWVKEHHAYYRHTKNPWVHHVQNMMKRDRKLRKVDYGKHKSGYVFKETDTQPAAAESTNDEIDDHDRNEDEEPAEEPTEEPHTTTSPPLELTDTYFSDQPANQELAEDLVMSEFPLDPRLRETYVSGETASEEPAEKPAAASHPSQLADISVNATEAISIGSDPLVKQTPGPETKFANFYARRSLKHPNDPQESTSEAKRSRHSDTASVKHVSFVATPSSVGQETPSSFAQSATAKRFEPLFNTRDRARLATGAAPSRRRFVIATDVSKDDGDEHDELS